MYSQKMVAVIKVGGKVLREQKDVVFIPFGSEYTISVKNLNSVRALVTVSIDGQSVTENAQLIVPANDTVDLERFIKSGNFEQGLRLRFIERTKKIEDGPRGIGAEDGLIRIQFEFEQQKPAYVPGPIYGSPFRTYNPPPLWNGPYYSTAKYSDSDSAGGATLSSTAGLMNSTSSATFGAPSASGEASGATAYNCSASLQSAPTKSATRSKLVASSAAAPVNDVGITVGGSVSDQKFVTGAWFPTDGQKHVMILKLLGQVGETRVKEAVTVKTKQTCPTCGTTNKFGTKFCKECGTGLTIV